jgi:hypothetical protein
MTVNRHDPNTIVLEGTCGVEDAEPLLQMLMEVPEPAVDWRSCQSLHTAVFQVLFKVRPRLIGPCGDAWAETWLTAEMPQATPVRA